MGFLVHSKILKDALDLLAVFVLIEFAEKYNRKAVLSESRARNRLEASDAKAFVRF